MNLMIKADPDGDLRGSLSIPPKIFGGRIGDFVMNMKIPQDVREWVGDVFRSERDRRKGNEPMNLPRLEIRTRQETGRLHSDLVFGDRSFHGVAGSVVDLVTMMGSDPNLPKEIQEWIGDTFWAENEKLKDQVESLVNERDRLEAEANALQDERVTILQSNKALHTDLAWCRQHAATSSRRIFELEEENTRLKGAIERQVNQILDLQAQIVNFKTENGGLRNAKLETRISELDMDKEELTDQIHNHQIEIQGLKDRIANFQDEAIDSDTLISDLEIKISEANKQILSLETDNTALRTKIEKGETTPLDEAHRTINLLLDRIFDR